MNRRLALDSLYITTRMAMFLHALVVKKSKDPECFNIHEVGNSRRNIITHLILSSKLLILKQYKFIWHCSACLQALLAYLLYIKIIVLWGIWWKNNAAFHSKISSLTFCVNFNKGVSILWRSKTFLNLESSN